MATRAIAELAGAYPFGIWLMIFLLLLIFALLAEQGVAEAQRLKRRPAKALAGWLQRFSK